jgi:hypothetical protein
VCADDYAIAPGTSRAIRDLLSAGRISATSVMAASEFWPHEAELLRHVAGTASIGLHLTLTDQVPLGPMPLHAPGGRMPPLGAAYKSGFLRRLPLEEIRAEITRQLESFVAHYGRPPMHIDGHHHIHQLPGVREAVVEMARSLGSGVWIRASGDRPTAILRRAVAVPKALAIAVPARGVRRLAARDRIPVNTSFTGVYDVIGDGRPFGKLVAALLTGVEDNGLMMCHPGIADDALAALDVMTTRRDDEYHYLMSDDWPRVLARHGLELGPFRGA